jgi:hypothetical protein
MMMMMRVAMIAHRSTRCCLRQRHVVKTPSGLPQKLSTSTATHVHAATTWAYFAVT